MALLARRFAARLASPKSSEGGGGGELLCSILCVLISLRVLDIPTTSVKLATKLRLTTSEREKKITRN